MKILMISKACVVGAYQKKLEEIAKHDGVELTVVVPPAWQDERGTLPLERAYTSGYQLRVEPIAFNGHFHFHYYPTLGRVIRQVRPDIVHVEEEPYNLATFQATWAARRLGARMVVFTWQNLQRRYPPPFRWMETYVLGHTDVLLAGNAEGVDVWRAKGYQGSVEVIPQFGVDPNIFSRIDRPSRPSKPSVLLRRSARRPSQNEMVIGYIGRLVPEKGIDILLEAVAQIQGPWELRILGSGPERDRLEKMAQWLGLLPRVSFDLPIPSTQMPYYYSGLDVLVLPSRTRSNWKEQFGRVLIEAMACRVVALGARCGAIPEVIGDAGLTFAEGDPADLRTQLQKLLGDANLRLELAEKGRQRVIDQFTQSRIAARTVEIYRSLEGDSPARKVQASPEGPQAGGQVSSPSNVNAL